MNILALDTSTRNYSLAVSKDKEVLAQKQFKLTNVLSKSVIPAIDKTLTKLKLKPQSIDGYAVGLGPGSFTGLRVGLSTIKALSYAQNKPVVGISSLDIIANGIKQDGNICVICDAKRDLVFSAFYTKTNGQLKQKGKHTLSDIKSVLEKVKGNTIFVGDGITLYKDDISKYLKGKEYTFADEKLFLPMAKNLIPLAKDKFKAKSKKSLNPIYLHPDDCQVRR